MNRESHRGMNTSTVIKPLPIILKVDQARSQIAGGQISKKNYAKNFWLKILDTQRWKIPTSMTFCARANLA